jgi:hypothetical protein
MERSRSPPGCAGSSGAFVDGMATRQKRPRSSSTNLVRLPSRHKKPAGPPGMAQLIPATPVARAFTGVLRSNRLRVFRPNPGRRPRVPPVER